ncbi:MAG: YncE family protein, partial [Luteolibacter sp.]
MPRHHISTWPLPPAPTPPAKEGAEARPSVTRLCGLASWVLMSCVSLLSCSPEKSEKSEANHSAPLLPAELSIALTHIDANRSDLALAILAAEPDRPETRQLLDQTIWYLPAIQIAHPGFEIHHIAIHEESLWVALANSGLHTIARWNLSTLEIDAILFPTHDPLRTFVLSPTASHAVATRGDVSLLIDARSLKPIADLGKIPTGITPESTITFSRDSLLLAHPANAAWYIRDTTTGEIIRRITPNEIPASPVLAAHLEPENLRLLTANGTRIDIPVSPVEPISIHPFLEEPLDILHAHLIDHGTTAIIIRNLGPHETPDAIEFDLVEKLPLTQFDIDTWATHQSHTPLAGLSTGLLRHLIPPPVELTESAIIFHYHPQAPLLANRSRDLQSQSIERASCPLKS